MQLKVFWLLILTGIVLVATASLVDAEEVFNFYIQKAPGPMVVNQGAGIAPSNLKDIKSDDASAVKVDNSKTTPEPVSQVAKAQVLRDEELISDSEPYRKWEFSLGYTMPYSSGKSDTGARALSGQYLVGLQLNVNNILGVFGEYLQLREPKQYSHFAGSRVDNWNYGVAVTPFRPRLDSVVSLSLTGLGGITGVPYLAGGTAKGISTKNVAFLGGRFSIDLNRKVALQASYRHIQYFKQNQFAASLAYMF